MKDNEKGIVVRAVEVSKWLDLTAAGVGVILVAGGITFGAGLAVGGGVLYAAKDNMLRSNKTHRK